MVHLVTEFIGCDAAHLATITPKRGSNQPDWRMGHADQETTEDADA
jgi:hypothetical protein